MLLAAPGKLELWLARTFNMRGLSIEILLSSGIPNESIRVTAAAPGGLDCTDKITSYLNTDCAQNPVVVTGAGFPRIKENE